MKKLVIAMLIVCTVVAHVSAQMAHPTTMLELIEIIWQDVEGRRYQQALEYSSEAIRLYGEEALEIQSVTNSVPRDIMMELYRPLNVVATAYLARAYIYEMVGNYNGALENYRYIVDNIYYAKIWDPKGWWFLAAEVAMDRYEKIANAIESAQNGGGRQ
jgi:tetratricopeptide (TPR) repeat protein